MDSSNNRMRILEMIEEGRVTAGEGLRLLQALNDAEAAGAERPAVEEKAAGPQNPPPVEAEPEIPLPGQPGPASTPVVGELASPGPFKNAPGGAASPTPNLRRWKRWWMVPLWAGVAVAVFGGLFMYLAQRSSGIGFWFVCATVPFLLGLVVIGLAWQSRNSPWLHLRVQQPLGEWPERIAFSFPLPVRPAGWFFRTFGRYIPGIEDQNLDQVIMAMGEKMSPENPIYIQVDEAENGEKVEIYIG